jgi:hypothetical protein
MTSPIASLSNEVLKVELKRIQKEASTDKTGPLLVTTLPPLRYVESRKRERKNIPARDPVAPAIFITLQTLANYAINLHLCALA